MWNKKPLAVLPSGDFKKFGFGLGRVPHNELKPRIDAVDKVLKLIEGQLAPEKTNEILDALTVVKSLYRRQYTCDYFDWFTTARMTGLPSPALANDIAKMLSLVRGSIINSDMRSLSEGMDRLRNSVVPDMLQCYLDMTVRTIYPPNEEGFAYILFSTSRREEVVIGATSRDVESVLRRLNHRYSDHHPFGVAAAYLLNDPDNARRLVKNAFEKHRSEKEFFRISLGDARKRLEDVLYAANEIVASPWHGEEPELENENPYLGVKVA